MTTLDTIPLDLPITNPLLFSWIVITQAAEINLHLSGRQERNFEKQLPAFEYFVRDWGVTNEFDGSNRTARIRYDIVCSLWKNRPESDCNITLTKNPNGSELCRPLSLDWILPFETWRTRTFMELDAMINALVYKYNTKERAPDKSEISCLSQKLGWQIPDEIQYFYVSDSTANQFYGVAGVFTLFGDFYNCCDKLDNEKMKESYLKDLGFDFQFKENS